MEKLIILVIASSSELYDQFITNYWVKLIKYIKEKKFNIEIFLLFNEKPTHLNINDSNVLLFEGEEESLIPGILNKTVNALEHINNNYEYSHILRTNLSSFLIVDQLIKVHNKLPTSNLYAGVIGQHGDLPFCSGAGFWLSPDIVKYIVEHKSALNSKIIDDLAIAELLRNKKRIRLQRFDMVNNVLPNNLEKMFSNIRRTGYYHVRVKNRDRSIDVKILTRFAHILYN